ncbi:MAG: PEP/pyruvate-binding domain-containing protein [Myxococcales bacterium]|nr:PEP/pyruvate-binding domain-containing protein [Myxococcales bacterium]
MTYARLAIAALLLLSAACRERKPAPAAGSDAGPTVDAASSAEGALSAGAEDDAAAGVRTRPVWTPKLASEEDFVHYSKVVGTDRFTKFVVDLKSRAIYYVDAALYPMHKDFVFAELLKVPRTKEAEAAFDRNYGRDKPHFLMCYLVHHQGPDVWSLSFWDGDKATAAHVRLAFERMRETFYLGAAVKFRPNSNDQEAVAAELAEIPVVTNDSLYKAAGYQPFHTGVAVGKLRIVRAGADGAVFAPDEIVILPEPLSDITPVAGIISQTFSTPLSHVNLRAAAWDIPNVGLRDAATTFAALDGKTVRLEATATSATVREATAQEVEAARDAKRARAAVQVPKADLAPTSLLTLDALRARDASAYGSKTANLGEIVSAKLPGVRVPPGFGVPIAHYAAHLRAAGIDAHIEAMLADAKFRASLAERKLALEKVRKEIQDAPLDPAFVSSLTTALTKLTTASAGDAGAGVGVFVRSSTNAEDLPGFSGAGLYDTVPNVRGADAVASAVKKVWASVWNLTAYEERELYRIDHRQVYGAVLVQVGVAATAAGVLVTAHPTDPTDKNTFTINAKSGLGMRVVDGKKVPEILLYNVFQKSLRVVSRSDEDKMLVFEPDGGVREVPSPKKGAPILTNARVVRLAAAAQAIRGVFPKDRPLDIEWVLRGDDVFIVQSRPYMGGPTSPRPPR